MGNLVDSDAVASALSAVTQDDNGYEEKYSDDPSNDGLLSCVARYIVDSRAFHFNIEMLGLPFKFYQDIEDDYPDDKHLIKFLVCHTKYQYLIQVNNLPIQDKPRNKISYY